MSKTIDEFFESNPHEIYELSLILDINMKNRPYYFNVVMVNINTKWNHTVLIAPEQLRNRYRVGYCYQNQKMVFRNGTLKKDLSSVEISSKTQMVKNDSLFHDVKDFIIDKAGYYAKYFLKQYSYKIDMQDFILIIPSYAIALRYYFMSSSMKNAIMEGDLTSLYYEYMHNKDADSIDIHIKTLAGIKDLPFLCRFLINNQANSMMSRHQYVRSKSIYENSQISSMFPVLGSIRLSYTYKVINLTAYDKPIRYVLNIQNDDSELGFGIINYRQYSSKKIANESGLTSIIMPKVNRYRRRYFQSKDNIVRQGSPSSLNAHDIMIDYAEHDSNTMDLVVNGINIYRPSNTHKEREFVPQTGSSSLETSRYDGDDSLSQISYYEAEQDRNNIVFSLNDFMEFYETLLCCNGVEELNELQSFNIQKTSNKNFKSKYNISDTNQARKFLFAIVAYDNRYVYIIEIEHNKSWQLATWFLVSSVEEYKIYDITFAQEVIQRYIDDGFTNEKLEKYVLKNYSLKLIHHNHKKGIVDDIAIDSWCDGILTKILQCDRSEGLI